MRILCLTDFVVDYEDEWLWNYLPNHNDEVDFLYITPGRDRFHHWGKILTYYPSYLISGLKAFRQTARKKYDVVVAWEGKNGFSYAVLRSLMKKQSPPFVILTFNYRGIIRSFENFARFAMKSVNHTTVLTPFEVSHYQKALKIPSDKISLCPLGWYDTEKGSIPHCDSSADEFVLSSGRSYRDYRTLACAVNGLDIKVIVIAREFNISGIAFPDNVKTMDLLPLNDFWNLQRKAKFVIVPLQETQHAAGDGHLIQAMSASKAIIATRTPTTETYLADGINGILVSPSNVQEMRNAIMYLLDNPSVAKKMGMEGRKLFESIYTMEAFAKRVRKVLENVCNETQI